MHWSLPEAVALLLRSQDRAGGHVPQPLGDLAIVSAALMELSLAGRIDTDRDLLTLIDPRPIGDAELDAVLATLAGPPQPSVAALSVLLPRARVLREAAELRLVAAGALPDPLATFLWDLQRPAVPVPRAGAELAARVALLLLSDEIPAPRDALLVGLVQGSGLMRLLLHPDQAAARAARIAWVAGLEALSRSLTQAMRSTYARLLRDGAVA